MTAKTPRFPWRRFRRGFSLIELLTTIGIIGTITAISIPMIGDVSDGAEDTTAKSNARSLATISAGLATIGVEHVIPASLGGIEATCRLLRRGITVPDGAYAGDFFGMPGLAMDQIPPATQYLVLDFTKFEARQLQYLEEGYEDWDEYQEKK